MIDRSVPFDLAAERAVLGSILLDRDAILAVSDSLQTEDFYLEKHALIYEAQLACLARRVPPDLATVASELRRHERLELVGGLAFLGEIVAEVPTAVHIGYYAEHVVRTATLRRLIETGGSIAALGFEAQLELDVTLDRAEQALFSVTQRQRGADFVPLSTVVQQYFDRAQHDEEDRAVPTGIFDLDARLNGGLRPGQLALLAARPGVGKSGLAMSIAYELGVKRGRSVGVVSLEMSRDELLQRLMAIHTGVDTRRIEGLVKRNDPRMLDALGVLSNASIAIEDTAMLSVMDVRSKARRLATIRPLDLLIVDYLQLLIGETNAANRVDEVSRISRQLKLLARELQCPILALSQLSRAVEQRASKVPQLSDLRDSGCLTGDTRVFLPDSGTYVRIDALVGNHDVHVHALNPTTWRFERRKVTNAFRTGRKPVFRLTTKLGRSIRATANHRFLTVEGWKRLDELQPGAHIAIPRSLPSGSLPTMSNDELALLGHLIGDGCTLQRSPIHYTTADEDLAALVVDKATAVFGGAVKPRIVHEVRWYQVFLSAAYRLTHRVRNPVAQWLDTLGVFNLRSHEKRVPSIVFSQPATSIALFLRHLWATDGTAFCRPSFNLPTISYATSSAFLARDVQSLLLRLDINACISRVPQGAKGRDQYHVAITGVPDQQRFVEQIGVVGARKQQMLDAVRMMLEGRIHNTNRDIIPAAIWGLFVRQQMRDARITTREFHARMGTRYNGSVVFRQNLSRPRAERIAQVVDSEELFRLASSEVYWDQIAQVVPDGEDDVYDLTVDGLHNFVADDIVVHNSLEQDADIVLFIYREEAGEDGEPGGTELYLAKQRNGPLGVIPVAFDAPTTRFRNVSSDEAPTGY